MRREDLTVRNSFSWKWLLILTYGDSRKTAFALWMALVATLAFLCKTIYMVVASLFHVEHPVDLPQLIDGQAWMLIVTAAAGLVGWGTKRDKELEIKKMEVANAAPAAVQP